VELKRSGPGTGDPGLRQTIAEARLLMGGPEPAAVADDPEAKEVLEELRATFLALPAEIQRDVALLSCRWLAPRETSSW
jgi:hypothetical protein